MLLLLLVLVLVLLLCSTYTFLLPPHCSFQIHPTLLLLLLLGLTPANNPLPPPTHTLSPSPLPRCTLV
jgi:hypothetical protein